MSKRILAAMMTLTALLLVGLVVPLGESAIRHDRQVFTDRTVADTESVSSLVEEQLADRGTPSGFTAAATSVAPRGSPVVVFNASGQVVDTIGPAPSVSPLQVAAALSGHAVVAATESHVLVIVPVRSGPLVVGATALVRGTAPLEHEVRELRITLALAGLVALAAAATMSLALARWVGRPLRRLDRAAASLGRGDLSARSRVHGGPPEVRELATSFDDMAARLQTLVDSHRNLVADVSHQLRTPLAAVRLRLELLAGDLADSDAATGEQPGEGHPVRELDGALVELARLSRLVDGLLAVARAEHTLPAPTRVNLAELARERAYAWAPVAGERGVNLLADAVGSVAASVTPGHLEQILDNLIANALDATPTGGEVTIRCVVAGGTPTIEVRDSGPGMTEEARRNAFHRFWSDPTDADPGAPVSGTGLGLAIVHRLVTVDGGEVTLDSAPGGGLAVRIRLRPARADAAIRSSSRSGAG
ncbi:MAG: sensor histidine kinase [Mycobacteriales bacterium]